MPHSKAQPGALVGAHKEVLACRLRMMGKDYNYIAERCGYSSIQKASQAVRAAFKRLPLEPVEELRNVELHRLDVLQDIAWRRLRILANPKKGKMRVVGGSRMHDPLDPIPVILKIMERRAKLVGLDAPEKHNVLFTEAQKISAETGIPADEIVQMAAQLGQGDSGIPDAFTKAFSGG